MNTTTHPGSRLPTTIPEYLEQLRAALAGADKAMIQDAVYDAEEYLRSELAENPGKSEAEVIASVAGSYGAPEEVADIYRETEVTVAKALRPPVPPKRKSLLGRFFGVVADARTYGALFCMLLSLAAGTPQWSLMDIAHLEQLPGIRWKLHNLAQLQKADAKKFAEQADALAARLG